MQGMCHGGRILAGFPRHLNLREILHVLKQLLFGPVPTASRANDLGLLALRVIGGLSLALAHGLGKMPPSARFLDRVADLGFPLPVLFAWAAALTEFAGGLLLVVGLLTRPAALFVIINFLVIIFHVQAGDPFDDQELPLLFLMVGLTLLGTGAGRYALDAVISRRRHP